MFLSVCVLLISGCFTNKLVDYSTKEKVRNLNTQTNVLETNIARLQRQKQLEIDRLKRSLMELQSKLEKETGEKNLFLDKTDEGIRLTILDKIIFKPGSTTINKNGVDVLTKVSGIIRDSNRSVQIMGYTDNTPIKRTKYLYKSNWELSMARCLNVLHLFEENGVDEKKMIAIGYGENRPVDTNETSNGRKNNRRVEIVIDDDVTKIDVEDRIK